MVVDQKESVSKAVFNKSPRSSLLSFLFTSLAFLFAIVSFKSILYFTLKRSVGESESPKRSFWNYRIPRFSMIDWITG